MCACEYVRTLLILSDRKPQKIFYSQIHGLQAWLDLGAQLLLSEICIFLATDFAFFCVVLFSGRLPPDGG